MEIEIVKPKPAPKTTDRQVNKAARELNMLTVSARGLRNFKTIGAFLEELGILEYGNGRLIGTGEAVARAINVCDQIINREDIEPDLKRDIMHLQLRLCTEMRTTMLDLVKLNNVAGNGNPKGELPNTPFLLRSQVPAVTVNIQNNSGVDSAAKPGEDAGHEHAGNDH